MSLMIVSGRSGSGKTTALQVLEDLGYHCIDNLPATLLPHLLSKTKQKNIAVCIDARNAEESLHEFPKIIDQLKQERNDLSIIFLDADNDALHKRFNASRRKHPLSLISAPSNSSLMSENVSHYLLTLMEAIDQESTLLKDIRARADVVIDSSHLNLQVLRDLVRDFVDAKLESNIIMRFQSFGFKHGAAPTDADFVFDVRCLPNPYWHSGLRALTGMDAEVEAFFAKEIMVEKYFKDIQRFVDDWLPEFEKNHRSYLTIAIGCTGGQHRSVYLAEKLCHAYGQLFDFVQVRHREITRESHVD